MSVSRKHTALLRQSLREEPANERPLKRRRRAAPPPEVIAISSSGSDSGIEVLESRPSDVKVDPPIAQSDSDDDLFEDVNLEVQQSAPPPGSEPSKTSSDAKPGSEPESDDFNDLEDVDIDQVFGQDQDTSDETLTFQINTHPEQPSASKRAKRSYKPISKEQRAQRLSVHKLVVFSMLCHGAIRNKWCSDPNLLKSLNKLVPQEVKTLVAQDQVDVLDYVKSKRLVDALRKLSSVYSRKFRCTSPGLIRYDWGEADLQSQLQHRQKPVTLDSFAKAIRSFQGSKDMGAQGFVAILRSVGIDARLVFSIQAPDYRSLKPAKSQEPIVVEDEPETMPQNEFDPVFIPNSRQELLSQVRKRKQVANAHPQPPRKAAFNFPVFWIEVWNKYSKKMITIDPIVFKIVEVMPMRRKSKFDAPGSEPSHQTWYVIAYNANGTLRDVTRRYTQFFNAKTAKKRMAAHSDDDENWYARILRTVGKKQSQLSNADAMEMKELYDRHICEGTPNNMADFKNHPVYALESQLRQDEVIYPNNESSKCGTFRSMNKKSVTTIYRRSHVCRLRTPKAWHMLGRVLKVGVQPLKVRKVNVNSMTELPDNDNDNDDYDEEGNGEVRLYAEFQTQLLIPPPIVDGQIPKNAYGNVEVFTPTMIPENGHLAKATSDVSVKLLEQAARTLNIDYAKAIVSFDFTGGSKNNRRSATPKEGGILIASEFREALDAVVEGLLEVEDDKRREAVEMNALRSWKFFLTKLRIIKRLDAQHGRVEDAEKRGDSEIMRGAVGNRGVKRRVNSGADLAADTVANKVANSVANRVVNIGGTNTKGEDIKSWGFPEESDGDDGYYSVGSEDEGSDNEHYVPQKTRSRRAREQDERMGGFLLQDSIPDAGEDKDEDKDEDEDKEQEEGGFILEGTDAEVNLHNGRSDSEMEGGFLADGLAEDSERSQQHAFAYSADSRGNTRLTQPNASDLTDSCGVQSEERSLGIEYSDSE